MSEERDKPQGAADTPPLPDERIGTFLTALAASMARSAVQLATRTGEAPLRLARTVLSEGAPGARARPDNLQLMYETGQYLRDLREVAGLTAKDLAAALDLKDASLIEAAESGSASLPFETILRLASLVARHDPVPFVIRMMRTYNPDAWVVLQNWGIGRLPLQLERERQFINIYRGHDRARSLDDAAFERVLDFTRAAFEMALHFADDNEVRAAEADEE